MVRAEKENHDEMYDLETEGLDVGGRKARGKGQKGKGNGGNRSTGTPSIFYLHSTMLFAGRFLSKILDFYNSFFEIGHRDKAKIYRNISTHYMNKGLEAKSLDYLKQWTKLEPANAEAHYQMALALAATGKLKSALKIFDRVLTIAPQHKGAMYRRCALLVKQKDYEGAVEGLEELLELVGRNAKVYYLLAIAYDGLEEIEKAIGAVENAIEIEPDEIKYHQHLGFLNVRSEDHKKAAQSFAKVMELERELDEDEYY